MTDSIIPVCLYKHYYSNDCYVSVGTGPVCQKIPELQYIATFYCINPYITPIPPGTVLLCAENIPQENVTTNISQIYNSLEKSNCTRFTAWFDPVPYTAPLYISQRGNSIYMSFDSKIPNDYTNLYFSPIYVLVDPRMKIEKTKGHQVTKNTFKIVNNEPRFLFSSYQGGCLPDPDGIPLENCVNKYVKNIPGKSFEPTLISYLNQKYKQDGERLLFSVLILISIIALILFLRN